MIRFQLRDSEYQCNSGCNVETFFSRTCPIPVMMNLEITLNYQEDKSKQ